MLPFLSPSLLSCLLVWAFSTQLAVVHAQTVGRLGISIYYSPSNTFIHYGSQITQVLDGSGKHLNLDDTNVLSDQGLVQIALAAWDEQENIRKTRYDQASTPTSVMVALQVKNEIFLSSSLKHNGPGLIGTFPSSPASVALERCTITSTQNQILLEPRGDIQSRTTGHCAEPMAVQAFYTKHSDMANPKLPQGARMVAVTKGRVVTPCDNALDNQNTPGNPRWGCSRFLSDAGIRAIQPGNQKVDIPGDWEFFHQPTCF